MLIPSEHQIQKALCLWLDGHAYPDVVWWHTPNGGARSAIEGKRFKETGVKAGIPDLFFLCAGRLYAIELKASGGTLSQSQKDMHLKLARAGIAGWECHDSLEAAKATLIDWGIAHD